MGAVLAITRMIMAYPFAFWHHLRHTYLFPSKTFIQNPETKVEKHSEATVIKWRSDIYKYESGSFNSCSFDTSKWRKPILDNVMEALGDSNIHIIRVYGSNSESKDTLLQRVRRRIDKDNLFDVVLTATGKKKKKKPNIKKIQYEIAGQLGFMFNEKSKGKTASELCDRIKNEQKSLIILCDLHKRLDLGKVGIPFGANHRGCKVLLTSTSEEELSNHMHTKKNSWSDYLHR